MKWTEEQTIYFVSEYVKYECLYNVNCPEYRFKHLRNTALLKLSSSMHMKDFGPRDAYLKIRSLKSTYAQEIKKIKGFHNFSNRPNEIYTPNIKWFKILHDALMAVNGTGECKDSTYNFETVSLPEVHKVELNLQHDSDTKSNEESEDSDAGLHTKDDDNLRANIKENPRKSSLSDYDNLLTKVQNVANAVRMPFECSENEFDIFGKSIAAQLKNMPLDKAIEAQMFIQNYLSEMRLKTLQRTTYTS